MKKCYKNHYAIFDVMLQVDEANFETLKKLKFYDFKEFEIGDYLVIESDDSWPHLISKDLVPKSLKPSPKYVFEFNEAKDKIIQKVVEHKKSDVYYYEQITKENYQLLRVITKEKFKIGDYVVRSRKAWYRGHIVKKDDFGSDYTILE